MITTKQFLLGLLLLSHSIGATGQAKRGMAYGHHSPNDLAVLSPQVSWWYNWSETPESSVAEVFTDYQFEFVPMTWNGSFNESKLRSFLADHPETQYLLAFNEPNFLEQANMPPSEVAALWPTLEAIADDFELEIVGPAVNFCGDCVTENGTTYSDPFDYLDDFFAACTDCRVDHIAVHSYMNNVSALSWYIGEFKRYGKPIWLTEFAGWEYNGAINSVNDQINFMVGAVDFLESDPEVFRYAWFIGRGSGIATFPYIDLLGADGTLTALGEVYKQMPVHDENQVVEIPATIEAEAYNTMEGILLELTADDTGFANVGWIDAGDWLEYKIRVPADQTYPLQFRVASTQNATLQLMVDGVEQLSQSISNTGGWQHWATLENSLALPAGEHTLRLQTATGGFNFNWFKIGNEVIANLHDPSGLALQVYPNPATEQVRLQASSAQACTFQLSGPSGKTYRQGTFHTSRTLQVASLPRGLYFITLQQGPTTTTQKLVLH